MRMPVALTGLALAGYGAIIVLGLMPHESPLVGVLSLVVGSALLLGGLPSLNVRRGRLVAALGASSLLGVVGYNLAVGSGLSLPEWGIAVYGAALLAAAPFLSRPVGKTDVGTLVGWSFPVVLAPLAMFSLNAVFTTGGADTAASPLVRALVVAPTAFALQLIGTDVQVAAHNNLVLQTPRGGLVLGVGLVCAGLYPMVLFGGMVALHGWRSKVPPKRMAAYLGVGLATLWLLNIVRLVILTRVGVVWGGGTLQTVHDHIGWVLFALFTVVFWGVVLRRVENGEGPGPGGAEPVRDPVE